MLLDTEIFRTSETELCLPYRKTTGGNHPPVAKNIFTPSLNKEPQKEVPLRLNSQWNLFYITNGSLPT